MTKNNEQIIINGVDVSRCVHFAKRRERFLGILQERCKCEMYYNEDCLCEIRTDCYYKQLKRKEQECEEWKHQAELGVDTTDRLAKELEEKEQECDNLRGEISYYEHDLGWCSSLIEVYEEKIMKCFYALHQIQLHNLKIKDKDIHLILKEVKEDLKEYNKMKNEELDKKVKE